MKRALILAVAAGLTVAFALAAQDHQLLAEANGIEITDGYAISAGPEARTGAAYMLITNTTDAPDRLIATEGDAARRIELHQTSLEDGVARMRKVEGGVALAPGATVALERGGLHVMMMGLIAPFSEDATIDLTMIFEKAGPIPVSIPVDRESPAGAHDGMGH